ncbi:Hypothetical Protein FCC1311_084192 [Hondaea fermentalgiana]|uniref:Uncharacterized protein n=1 Tax=Hondaea fermentalgiana TaxID=2315210 RepID=A0A2R5GW77_9STRA|nr:Hypothetical Protein FCC1311_084192 [Hondaea fermentalgiana]|eukprot:GBG32194.1 Hypothetical Protein FCC1311_084192 [Hondaea fermentalgiana]
MAGRIAEVVYDEVRQEKSRYSAAPPRENEVQTDFVFDAVKVNAGDTLSPEHFAQLFDYTGFSRIFTVSF